MNKTVQRNIVTAIVLLSIIGFFIWILGFTSLPNKIGAVIFGKDTASETTDTIDESTDLNEFEQSKAFKKFLALGEFGYNNISIKGTAGAGQEYLVREYRLPKGKPATLSFSYLIENDISELENAGYKKGIILQFFQKEPSSEDIKKGSDNEIILDSKAQDDFVDYSFELVPENDSVFVVINFAGVKDGSDVNISLKDFSFNKK